MTDTEVSWVTGLPTSFKPQSHFHSLKIVHVFISAVTHHCKLVPDTLPGSQGERKVQVGEANEKGEKEPCVANKYRKKTVQCVLHFSK